MKLTYREFLKYDIDLGPLGLERRAENETYFCTPKGARIIGWTGVDGIHYCFIRGFGEMVFAVSPMNIASHYVHPVAKNFSDFLRLLLVCGSSAALEQAWQWNVEQFAEFLAGNLPVREQKIVLEKIAKQTGLSPMQNPWQYLHELQTSFDFNQIKYTEDFYDLEINPEAPRQPEEWKVFYDGNFWSHSNGGRAGKEKTLGKEFEWAGHHWLLPSVYLCSRGLVMDFCMQVESSEIRGFMEKWNLYPETEALQNFTQKQRMQIDLDNPLHLDFRAVLQLNGKQMSCGHGCGTVYNPCLSSEHSVKDEARRAMEHYRLNPNYGWVICRSCYPWATKRKPEIRNLSVTMIQDTVAHPGPHFQVAHPGDTVVFPYNGQKHTLTVQEYEAQTVDWSRMPDTELERPSHYMVMSYTIIPDLPDGVLTVSDCEEGDRPRQASSAPGQPVAASCVMVMGIIGGADGPTAILGGSNKQEKLHAACSSLHFEPVDQVEWRMVFYEKQFEDTEIALLPE